MLKSLQRLLIFLLLVVISTVAGSPSAYASTSPYPSSALIAAGPINLSETLSGALSCQVIPLGGFRGELLIEIGLKPDFFSSYIQAMTAFFEVNGTANPNFAVAAEVNAIGSTPQRISGARVMQVAPRTAKVQPFVVGKTLGFGISTPVTLVRQDGSGVSVSITPLFSGNSVRWNSGVFGNIFVDRIRSAATVDEMPTANCSIKRRRRNVVERVLDVLRDIIMRLFGEGIILPPPIRMPDSLPNPIPVPF